MGEPDMGDDKYTRMWKSINTYAPELLEFKPDLDQAVQALATRYEQSNRERKYFIDLIQKIFDLVPVEEDQSLIEAIAQVVSDDSGYEQARREISLLLEAAEILGESGGTTNALLRAWVAGTQITVLKETE